MVGRFSGARIAGLAGICLHANGGRRGLQGTLLTTTRQRYGWSLRLIHVTLDSVDVTPQQAAAVLRQRSAEARERAESHTTAVRSQAIDVVRGHLRRGTRAWLIGSLAWGGFGERSDIDLVFDDLDSTLATSVEIALCKAVGVEVDLLTFQDLPPAFRARVEREGIAIHGQ